MVWALLGAVAIGLSLGLLGAGGSILTVPILLYVLGWDPNTAITGSLFVVGGIAAANSVQFAVARKVEWRSVWWFGAPGMLGAYLAGRFLPPLLDAWLPPREGGGFDGDALKLSLFAVVMLLASVLMFRPPRLNGDAPHEPRARWKIALDGLVVGALTGLVGVGGGFLIVPALVLLGGLPMHLAVGTSLVVIAAKSYTGFAGWYAGGQVELDWGTLWLFVVLGAAGGFAGKAIGGRVSQARLRRVFAVFLVGMGTLMLLHETGVVAF